MTSDSTPWWRHRQRERFARAVDSSPQDGEAHDPKLAGELAVVLMLRRTAEATAPDTAARDRMRTALFEGLAESADTAATTPTLTRPDSLRPSPVPRATPTPRPGSRPESARPPGRPKRVTGTRGRLAIALTAAFCLLLALSGMTLFLARDALPGDPFTRCGARSSRPSLGLTMGGEAKGLKHLEYAADRINDVESLVARYPDLANSPVGDYLTAFADFDTDASAGAST